MIGRWFNEGAEAHGNGVLANDCPYLLGSKQQGQWLAGWTQAHERATTSQPNAIAKLQGNDQHNQTPTNPDFA